MSSKRSKKNKLLAVLLVLCIIGGIGVYVFYRAFYYPGTRFDDKSKLVYIRTGSTFGEVLFMLENKHIINKPRAFKILADIKGYKNAVKPGRYRIVNGMNNVQIIDLLVSGNQEPESLRIHNIRTIQELAGMVAQRTESDSSAVIHAIIDKQTLKKFGFNTENINGMFIPGNYSILWTETPQEFVEQMHAAYEDFWTDARRKEAAAIPLTPLQVTVLASIVQAEQSQFDDEKPVIAGLYINRLQKDIPLQSDPTLVFAKGDFSINRVLDKDKKVVSPYNTYMHNGLPPGPIDMPEPSSLDAVLNYQKSDYLYMCAECDFSGRHHFSKTIKEQEQCAIRYRQALTKRGIMR